MSETILPLELRDDPVMAVAYALREQRNSPDTIDAGLQDIEDADEIVELLRAAGWALKREPRQ